MPITTTLNQISECNFCTDGWETLLLSLNKTESDDEPLPLVDILDSNGLDDAVWCSRTVEGLEKEIRLFNSEIAREVRHLMRDPRSVEALDVAERFAHGDATDGELEKAYAAADAAADAARTAAYAAYAALATASAAAYSAARAAASTAVTVAHAAASTAAAADAAAYAARTAAYAVWSATTATATAATAATAADAAAADAVAAAHAAAADVAQSYTPAHKAARKKQAEIFRRIFG
jgi:hypothetical protein